LDGALHFEDVVLGHVLVKPVELFGAPLAVAVRTNLAGNDGVLKKHIFFQTKKINGSNVKVI
jgi:hypothetical protein